MTWIAPEVDRAPTLKVADERTALENWLTHHRLTLLKKCSGLTEEQLKLRTVEPSTLSLLGLVRHMAEVERWWFRRRFAGRPLGDIYCSEEFPDGDFDLLDSVSAESVFANYHEECQLADEAAAGHSLEQRFTHRRAEGDIEFDLRWVYIHMIEEYARHNGHADLLRERIDGVTGQ
jgi:uncharacterized damage-inducible protein DinB